MNYYDWNSALNNPFEVKTLRLSYDVHQDYSRMGEFSRLEFLQLSNFPYYAIPESISHLSQLKTLSIYGRLKQFPLSLTKLSSLIHLYLYSSGLKELPYEFKNLQLLEKLEFKSAGFKTIPSCIFDLPHLSDLSLETTPIENLDTNIAKALVLKNLNLTKTKIKSLPWEISLLNLDKILLGFTPFYTQLGDQQKKIEALLKQFQKQNLSPNLRKLYFLLFLGDFSSIENMANEAEILEGLNNPNQVVRFQTLQYLHQKYKNPFLILNPTKFTKIYLAGKYDLPDLETMNETLNPKNYQVVDKFDQSIDWVVLGESPRKILNMLHKNQLSWTIVGHFKDYYQSLEEYYLSKNEPENVQIIQNLLSLLRSPEEANQLLALEMVLGGGINELFFYDILMFYLWNPNQKTRNLAEKILQKFLPSNTFMQLKTQAKKWYSDPSEEMLVNYLKNIESTGFEIDKLSLYFYRKTGKIKSLCLSMPIAFGEICKDLKQFNVLSLANLKLKNLLPQIKTLPEIKFLYLQNNSLTDLPSELSNLVRLKILNLANNHFSQIPACVFQLSQIEELDLSGNKLDELPVAITQLPSLRFLNLRNNKLKTIPDEISKLKNLNNLDLRGNPISSQKTKISILLPDCKILMD